MNDWYNGPLPTPDQIKNTKRGPYKRGQKSTESGPVVGVYEGGAKESPMVAEGKRGQHGQLDASMESIFIVMEHEPLPLPPVTAQRPNIPNRYDREALADFYKTEYGIERANCEFSQAINRGLSSKDAFAATLFAVNHMDFQ